MTSSRQAQVDLDVIKKFYDALNGNNPAGAAALMTSEVERTEFPGTPGTSSLKGLDKMTAHIQEGRSTWAEGRCQPKEFFVSGEKVVVDVHVHVRQKGQDQWIDARIGDAFALEQGHISAFHSFTTLSEALAWAGIGKN